jgi:hypothetical protein
MKNYLFIGIIFLLTIRCSSQPGKEEIYMKSQDQTVWFGFENPTGAKGAAGQENKGAKGHPSDRLASGDSCVLLDMKGAGIVNRIWMTVKDRRPEMLRALWIKMYWDDSPLPAVSAPLGDFFCNGLSMMKTFENCFFSNPEGRSMNCTIQMPFKSAARIVLINQSAINLSSLFYDIEATRLKKWNKNMLYFHTFWNRENPTALGRDFEILPDTKGAGRFLGVSVGVATGDGYKQTWWGEGEIKFYIDGDTDFPSLCGTGTEDYIGTAWGQGRFYGQYQGCLIANEENRLWSFYRFHVPDPVFFSRNCRVTLQQMGGADYSNVLEMYKEGIPLIPVSLFKYENSELVKLMDNPMALDDPSFPDGWVNYYRQDDVSSVAYFYLDRP